MLHSSQQTDVFEEIGNNHRIVWIARNFLLELCASLSVDCDQNHRQIVFNIGEITFVQVGLLSEYLR